MGAWLLVGVIALLWSAVALALLWILGGGSALVFEVGRALGYAPAAIQELADRLAEAGPAGQVLVAIVWLLGLGFLAWIGLVLSRPTGR
ncbi:hypothetical protein [Thermaurantiacus sp.]